MNNKNICITALIVVMVSTTVIITSINKSKGSFSEDIAYNKSEVVQNSEPIITEKFSLNQENWGYKINSEEITHQTHEAFYTDFDNGIQIHSCWCYGIKVNLYNPTETYLQEIKDNIEVLQIEDSRDLVFTDNTNVLAYYDAQKEITFSIIRDGLRTLRHQNYSVYIYPSGLISYVSYDGRVILRNEWQKKLSEEAIDTKVSLDEVLQMENKYSNLLLIRNLKLGKSIN